MLTGSTSQIMFSEPAVLIGRHSSKILIVLMPGVLMNAEKGYEPLIPAIMEACDTARFSADLVYADYAVDQVDYHELVAQVGYKFEEFGRDAQYQMVLPIGASFSGLVVNAAYSVLGHQPAKLAAKPILIDSPFGATFPGATVVAARAMGLIRFPGTVADRLNKNTDRFTGSMNLPKNKNIGNTADFSSITGGEATTYLDYVEWAKEKARDGLSGHKTTLFASQVGAMSNFTFTPFPSGVTPIYLACTDADVPDDWEDFSESIDPKVTDEDGNVPVERPKNDTVAQPKAADCWIEACRNTGITVLAVRSTHCGFMERPKAWKAAMKRAIMLALER